LEKNESNSRLTHLSLVNETGYKIWKYCVVRVLAVLTTSYPLLFTVSGKRNRVWNARGQGEIIE
jgi:hypothetical protein